MTGLWRRLPDSKDTDKDLVDPADTEELLVFSTAGRLRRDAGFRRRIILIASGAFVLIAGLATAATAIALSVSSASLADRAAEISDVFAGTTLSLTIVGALVALLAFAVSTGGPDLKLQIRFESSHPNRPVFKALVENGWLKAERSGQTTGTISVRNDSIYPAKNLAIVVRLEGMAFAGEMHNLKQAGWVINEFAGNADIEVAQWDGSSTALIHGHSARQLAVLDLAGLRILRGSQGGTLRFDLLADGYRKITWMPVNFSIDGKSQFSIEKVLPEWF
jgi:hypothetical protein